MLPMQEEIVHAVYAYWEYWKCGVFHSSGLSFLIVSGVHATPMP